MSDCLRSLVRAAVAVSLLVTAACEDRVSDVPRTGTITINAIAPQEQPAASQNEGNGGGRSPAEVLSHLDSAKVNVQGGTTNVTQSLTNNGAAGFSGSVPNLPVGTYTVSVWAFDQNAVDQYTRTTGVTVTAGGTTTANVTFPNTFVPVIGSLSATTTAFRMLVPITPATLIADSFKVESALASAFTGTITTTSPWPKTTATVAATFSPTGALPQTQYIRVSSANTHVTAGGRPSSTVSVSLVTDNHTPPSTDDPATAASITGANPLVGTTIRLDSLNIYPAGDVDWFAFRNCNGDNVTITAQAVRLTPPSPLNSVIQVYDDLGRTIALSDNVDSSDARVVLAITSDGLYRIRVSGGAALGTQVGPVGHYRLEFQPTAGNNNLTTSCRLTALPVTSIATNYVHACAIRTNNNIDCWGNNANGQLGNGTTTLSSSPVRASGAQVLQTVTAGRFHACGRTSANAAWCWGSNSSGQLGDGSATQRTTPVPVGGTQSYTYLEAGSTTTCGLFASGIAYCWGNNANGEFGNGSTANSLTPVVAGGGVAFSSLAVGNFFACGATAAGAASCWGYNGNGQLGNGTNTNSSTPVAVQGALVLHGLVAGDDHACGLNAANQAYCWGNGGDGQLGTGGVASANTPQAVVGGLAFTSLAAGAGVTCGLSGGAAYCWGDNYDGQLGDGSTIDRTAPTLVSGGLTFTALAAGWFSTCGIQSGTGNAYCWGWNGFGQLGDGQPLYHLSPVPVTGGTNLSLQSISTTGSHSCGITTGGTGYCWGSNVFGELGDGSGVDRLVPTQFAGAGYTKVAVGEAHSCALIPNTLYCWGLNFSGQLGDATNVNRNLPTLVTGNFSAVTAGWLHTCALSGAVVNCWGRGTEGELGQGVDLNRNTPGAVTGSYSSVAAGGYHTCAIRSGIIDCWGNNLDGQLGNGSTTSRNTPLQVTGSVTTYAQVALGGYHTCGITTAGVAYCWGYNGSGQLGDGTFTQRSSPVIVSGSLVFQSISAGDNHTCGITTTNALYCWGNSFAGQLGNGLTQNFNTPQQIGTQFAWTGVDAGGQQTCGYTANAVMCWGNNERGQLGYNRRTIVTTPQIVITGPASAPPLMTMDAGIEAPWGPAPRGPRGPTGVNEGAPARGIRGGLPH